MSPKAVTDRNAGRQVYLAGPMRNYPAFNFPAFRTHAARLRAAGYKVFSPAEEDLRNGFDPETGKYPDGEYSIRKVMMEDLMWICQFADMVVVFGEWRQSKGVRAEVRTADAISVPVYELDDVLSGILRRVLL